MGKRIAIFPAPLVFWLIAAPAHADVNEVQIDWMISEQDWANVSPQVRGRSVSFDFRMLPSKLFENEEDLVAEDGTKLLPAGTQLYAMTGPTLAVCSQMAAKQPFVGASKRVCLRDDDGDGSLDSYWLRFPIQQLLGKAEWLFLTGEIPIQRSRVLQPRLRNIASDMAEKPGQLSLSFSLRGDGSVTGGVWVKDGAAFYGSCVPIRYMVDHVSKQWCLIPDLIVRGINFDSKKKNERHLEVDHPKRDVKVRFRFKQGLIATSIQSIYLD